MYELDSPERQSVEIHESAGAEDFKKEESMSSGKHYDASEVRDPVQGEQSEYASEHAD